MAFWTSQSCRMLMRLQSLGPLVLTAIEMVRDVLNFLWLLAGVIVGFSSGLLTLYKAYITTPHTNTTELINGTLDLTLPINETDVVHGPWHGRLLRSFHRGDSDDDLNLSEDCERLGEGLVSGITVLFEVVLGNTAPLACMRAGPGDTTTAVVLMDLFLVVGVLLGTNMLIALMAKRFDLMYENQKMHYMYVAVI